MSAKQVQFSKSFKFNYLVSQSLIPAFIFLLLGLFLNIFSLFIFNGIIFLASLILSFITIYKIKQTRFFSISFGVMPVKINLNAKVKFFGSAASSFIMIFGLNFIIIGIISLTNSLFISISTIIFSLILYLIAAFIVINRNNDILPNISLVVLGLNTYQTENGLNYVFSDYALKQSNQEAINLLGNSKETKFMIIATKEKD